MIRGADRLLSPGIVSFTDPRIAAFKEQIRQQLLSTKRSNVMSKWVSNVDKEFAKKISYQSGFTPPATTTASPLSVTTG